MWDCPDFLELPERGRKPRVCGLTHVLDKGVPLAAVAGPAGRHRRGPRPAMIPDPAPNTVTRPYRGLSVQEVQVPLTGPAVAAYLLGREVYRRTDYLVLRSGAGVALVAVRRAADEVTSTGTSLPASTCAHATARPGQGRTAGAGVGRTAGRC